MLKKRLFNLNYFINITAIFCIIILSVTVFCYDKPESDEQKVFLNFTSTPVPSPVLNLTPTLQRIGISMYNISRQDAFKSVTKTSDGGFIAVGYGYKGAFIYKFDMNGKATWIKTVDSVTINSVIVLIDGGIIALGVSGGDGLLLRLDNNGNIIWKKLSERSCSIEFATQTDDGGFIVAGMSDLIVKFDKNGEQEWEKNCGNRCDKYNSVIKTKDGDFIVGGYSGDTSIGASDGRDIELSAKIVKLDSNGNILWSFYHIFHIEDIIENSEGDLFVVGNNEPSPPTHTLDTDNNAVIIKLDRNGKMIWKKYYKNSYNFTNFNSIKNAEDKYFISVGDIGDNPFICKIDYEGNIIWNKVEKNGYSYSSVILNDEKGYLACGSSPFKENEAIVRGAVIFSFDKDGNYK